MSGGKNEERPPLGTEGAQENNGGDRDPCKVPAIIPGIDGPGDGNCLLPSKEAVREALRLIHTEGPWHVSAKREKGFTGKVYDAEGGAAGWAVAQNRTLNAYVSIAALRPGWNGDKATKADVASVGWLWVDLDPRAGEDLDLERARLLGLLTTNLPKGVPPPTPPPPSPQQTRWRWPGASTMFSRPPRGSSPTSPPRPGACTPTRWWTAISAPCAASGRGSDDDRRGASGRLRHPVQPRVAAGARGLPALVGGDGAGWLAVHPDPLAVQPLLRC